MYNIINFNISGDLHIHLGNDTLDSILPDELAEDEAENETEIEDYETDEIAPSGLFVSVEGLPADVDREAVESIMAEFVDLLNNEVREALKRRKDESHERV